MISAHGVLIGPSVTDRDAKAAAIAARDLGLDLEVDAERVLGVDASWSLVVSVPLAAFLGQLGSKLGEDAHQMLARFVRAIAKRKGRGEVRLVDERQQPEIILSSDLPDSAYSALLEGDLPRTGSVVYDERRGAWRPRR